jgi:hypothetical protein
LSGVVETGFDAIKHSLSSPLSLTLAIQALDEPYSPISFDSTMPNAFTEDASRNIVISLV